MFFNASNSFFRKLYHLFKLTNRQTAKEFVSKLWLANENNHKKLFCSISPNKYKQPITAHKTSAVWPSWKSIFRMPVEQRWFGHQEKQLPNDQLSWIFKVEWCEFDVQDWRDNWNSYEILWFVLLTLFQLTLSSWNAQFSYLDGSNNRVTSRIRVTIDSCNRLFKTQLVTKNLAKWLNISNLLAKPHVWLFGHVTKHSSFNIFCLTNA